MKAFLTVVAIAGLIASASCVALAQEPKRVAFLVGINDYQKPFFQDLKYAERDVTETEAALKTLGFETAVLTGTRATRRAIDDEITKLVKPLTKNDIALVLLCGHGQQIDVKLPNGAIKNDAFYCPVDAVASDPKTMISLSRLIDDQLSPNVGRKLVLVDACRNDPDPGRGRGIEGKKIALPEGTALMFSCRQGQRAYEHDKLRHGLFTYCLVEGLRGAAAKEELIEWSDLVSHINRRMASAQLKQYIPAGLEQVPIPSGGVPYTVLGRLIGKSQPPEVPPEPIPEASSVVNGVWELAIDKTEDGKVPSGCLCPPNTYQVRTMMDGSRQLCQTGKHLSFITMPPTAAPYLTGDFEMSLKLILNGGRFELVVQHGAATRRLQIFLDRGWTIGDKGPPPGTEFFPRDQVSTLQIIRKKHQVSLFFVDHNNKSKLVLVRQFSCDQPLTMLHFALPENCGVTGLHIARMNSPALEPTAQTVLSENFLTTEDGKLPARWERNPTKGAIAVTSAMDQPCLQPLGTDDALLSLPQEWADLLVKDFILEADVFVEGGALEGPCLELIFVGGKQSARYPCYIDRDKIYLGKFICPSPYIWPSFKPSNTYGTIRFTRQGDQVSIGMLPLNADGPVIFGQQSVAKVKLDSILTRFAGGQTFRLQAMRLQSTAPQPSGPGVIAPGTTRSPATKSVRLK